MKKTPWQKRRVLARWLSFGALLSLALALPLLSSSSSVSSEPAVAGKYIGSKKCESCHKDEAGGNQWGAWEAAGHSKAFEVLLGDDAKKIAAERGIADASKSDECLKCHVTAFGVDKKLFKKSFDPEAGVGCESCHGPGDDHARARFRAANEAEDEEEGFGDEEEAEATYTKLPDGEIGMGFSREDCVKCHNKESPTYKPFCYYERIAKVRHLNPLKPRTAEEKAAMLVCGCGEACECDHDCKEGCGVPPKK